MTVIIARKPTGEFVLDGVPLTPAEALELGSTLLNLASYYHLKPRTGPYKIEQIKLIRELTDAGLKRCKDAVESQDLYMYLKPDQVNRLKNLFIITFIGPEVKEEKIKYQHISNPFDAREKESNPDNPDYIITLYFPDGTPDQHAWTYNELRHSIIGLPPNIEKYTKLRIGVDRDRLPELLLAINEAFVIVNHSSFEQNDGYDQPVNLLHPM